MIGQACLLFVVQGEGVGVALAAPDTPIRLVHLEIHGVIYAVLKNRMLKARGVIIMVDWLSLGLQAGCLK